MGDLLKLDAINSLPQPLYIRFYGDKNTMWPVESIDTETGCARIDVCWMLQTTHISEFSYMQTSDGDVVDIESLYCDHMESE